MTKLACKLWRIPNLSLFYYNIPGREIQGFQHYFCRFLLNIIWERCFVKKHHLPSYGEVVDELVVLHAKGKPAIEGDIPEALEAKTTSQPE
ncbi:MAG: hypothetical protein FWE32_09405 [Oscillospiraceae bacterium]|nr:hypothetical protein [Oscillospiraceae bacterium]